MADIANLKIGTNTYGIKDTTARTTASSAETKSDQAIADSATAQATANTANTNALKHKLQLILQIQKLQMHILLEIILLTQKH